MGQRVGANVRQYHKIKKMHAEGVSAHVIAKTFRMTPQSLEKILAHLDGRAERVIEAVENPELAKLKAENEALKAKIEGEDDGEEGEADEGPDDEQGSDEEEDS
jgi:hypothetical protein